MLGVFRQSCSSRLPSQFLRSRPSIASSIRRYATAQTPKPAARPPSPLKGSANSLRFTQPTLPARPSTERLQDSSRLHRVELAQTLYNNGQRVLYRTSSRLRWFRFSCWFVAAMSVVGITTLFQSGLMDFRILKERGLHPMVGVAYIVVGMFLSGVASICIARTRGHIRSVGLVNKAEHVFLEIETTSFLPFQRSTALVRPYDILIDNRVVRMLKIPDWMLQQELNESSPAAFTVSVLKDAPRALSRFVYVVYSAFRQFFHQDGIVSLDIAEYAPDKKKTYTHCKLDMAGDFLLLQARKHALFELGQFKDPYAKEQST